MGSVPLAYQRPIKITIINMYKTEKRIQNTFFKLLKTYEINQIDVTKICKASKITRQTFYYHFESVYDLIFAIYIDKNIESKNSSSIKDIVSDFVSFLYKDEKFNKDVVESNASSVLSEVSFSFLFQTILKYLKKYDIDGEKKRIVARFLARAIGEEILYLFSLITTKKEDIVEEINKLVNENMIKGLISKF